MVLLQYLRKRPPVKKRMLSGLFLSDTRIYHVVPYKIEVLHCIANNSEVYLNVPSQS